MWRAVSVNNEAKTTKLVTQWNISTSNYNKYSDSSFAGSYMEDWLNDTSVDGFLYNLRDYENFTVTNSVWDATLNDKDLGSIERPNGTSVVTDAVGLLNVYEYQASYDNSKSYLNNDIGPEWWTITPTSFSAYRVANNNIGSSSANSAPSGIRPAINLKSNVRILDGNGTENNPYRLEGDNDSNLSGTMLNTRYIGEYIRFGSGENNLYRIVSHETDGLTKITSAEPLKSNGEFIESAFDINKNANYSSSNTIGTFLNGEYLTNYVGDNYINMIEDDTTWYLGKVQGVSYKLAKYTDETGNTLTSSTTTAKVGLLRLGELMAGQFDTVSNNANYWLLTPTNSTLNNVTNFGDTYFLYNGDEPLNIKPALNLKSNVVITSGDGTKNNPFQIELSI